jgi:hypothetical protein
LSLTELSICSEQRISFEVILSYPTNLQTASLLLQPAWLTGTHGHGPVAAVTMTKKSWSRRILLFTLLDVFRYWRLYTCSSKQLDIFFLNKDDNYYESQLLLLHDFESTRMEFVLLEVFKSTTVLSKFSKASDMKQDQTYSSFSKFKVKRTFGIYIFQERNVFQWDISLLTILLRYFNQYSHSVYW